MNNKHCPFCMKSNIKGYPFTLATEKYAAEPYDTSINKVCPKCCHCPEMENALNHNEYGNLTEFCLSLVNGRGEHKSLRIVFDKNKATVFTTPRYRETQIPAPFTIGENEMRTLRARLYNIHAELWNDLYSTDSATYVWWELQMKFNDKSPVCKRGTDRLPPQWNRLIKVIGVYYEWLYYDWSYPKMYKLKYNHKTRQRELPQNTVPPFFDYWNTVKDIPETIELPTADDLVKGTKVCIYARSNGLMQYSSADKQLNECRDFCKALKLQIVAEYIDEGETGLNEMGGQLKRLFADIDEKKFGYVVLASVSRFSRDIQKAANIRKELEKHNVKAVILPPKRWGYWLNY